MDARECIRTRASVRSFKTDDIPDDVVDDILSAAVQAPNAGNIQEWSFVVVRKPGNRKRLAQAAFEQNLISDAPVVVVVCADLGEIGNAYGERGESLFSVQDTAAAAQNLMLAAWDRGIGSCWVGSFNENAVREIIVLPGNVRPMAIIPLGYPASKPKKPARKEIKEVVRREFY
jgi:nitroreductase